MAVTSPVPGASTAFKFGRNLPLLNQKASLGFEVSSGIRPDVVTALLSGTTPFPDRDIDLAEVALNASTPAPIEFARGSDKVSFSASGGVFAGFGVYRRGGALLNRLGDRAQDFALEALEFGTATCPRRADAAERAAMGILGGGQGERRDRARRGGDGDARRVGLVGGAVRGDPSPAVGHPGAGGRADHR